MRTVFQNPGCRAALAGLVVPYTAYADSPAPPSDTSGLHLHLMWTCIAVGVIVFAFIFYSVVEFRRSHTVLKAPWHATTTREMLWTAIPFIMLVVLVTPATRALIAAHDAQKDPMTIEVSAAPVEWRFPALHASGTPVTLPLEELATSADGRPEIVLPSHRRIHLRFAAGRATWSIPDAGFRHEPPGGAAADSWLYLPKSGVYEASCSGNCAATAGAPLHLRVRAVPQGIYEEWLQHAARDGAPAPVGMPAAPRAR
ncbi:MAG: hypothetical protein HY749_09305 [Gammaproteobacteria bacterium]|nr:hypothetical protein [Gammaproteobacteria bacterium]